MNKYEFLQQVKEQYIVAEGYLLADVDELKPWGAYYRLADECAEQFVKQYFPGRTITELGKGGSLSPKFLIFEPGKQLSLQYHNRRAEIWNVIEGVITAGTSSTDEITDWNKYKQGDELSYGSKVRHRAGVADGAKWAVVAEIWQHTDKTSPTDESDIVRLVDDFGRA